MILGLPALGNPWVILGGVIVVASLCSGSYLYGHSVATDSVNVKWQQRELAITAKSSVVAAAAQTKVLVTERAAAVHLAGVSAKYQTKLKEKDRERDAAIVAAVSGGLFVDTVDWPASGDTVPTTTPAAVGCNGPARARLSDEAVEFFVGEASRADKITEQLAACQAIVKTDREQ